MIRSALNVNFEVLTGFRAIAILWVIFSHLPFKLPDVIDRFQHRWAIGVDLFLAISGYLVTRSLFQCDQTHSSRAAAAKDFAVRRISRIFPPYYATVLLIAILALFVDPALRARLTSASDLIPSFLFFFSNYTMPDAMDRVPAFLIMTWSLSFQEQFYATLVAFYMISKRYLGPLLIGAGLLSMALRFWFVFTSDPTQIHPSHLMMWLHLRFDAVAWACAAWIYGDRLRRFWATRKSARAMNWLTLLLVAGVLAAHSEIPGFLPQAIIYSIKGPALALVVLCLVHMEKERGWFPSLLRRPWLGQIGISAYEIYLLNTLIVAAVLKLNIQNPWVASALIYLLTVGSGWFAYRIFGRPLKKVFRRMFGS